MARHELADLGFGLGPQAASVSELAHEVTVIRNHLPEGRGANAVILHKAFDIGKERFHADPSMCDISHRQGVKFPDWRKALNLCVEPRMMSTLNMDSVRSQIDRLMKVRKIARKPLAKKAGLGETAIRDIFDPKRTDVRASTLVKLAEFFEVTIDELTAGGPIPLLGRIGVGGYIIFEPEEADGTELVPRPPLAGGQLIALEVVGDSMLPKYDPGDVVYIHRDHDGIPPQYLGDYCAVRTADGGTWLKILSPGTEPGRYILRSLNAADMLNVEVVWASPVVWVMPRRSREHSS